MDNLDEPQIESPPRLDRSPHPYRRHSRQDSSQGSNGLLITALRTSQSLSDSTHASPTSDQRPSWDAKTHVSHSDSPSESGTEADDESGILVRALPAPPYRPRKGLRGQPDDADEEATSGPMSFHAAHVDTSVLFAPLRPIKGGAQKQFRQTRAAELLRRTCEVLLSIAIGSAVVMRRNGQDGQFKWPDELSWHTVLLPAVCIVHLFRLFALPYFRDSTHRLGAVIIPSSFDPAPMLYPTLLPAFVSMSITDDRFILLGNSILGLASIPAQLIPHLGAGHDLNILHWLLCLLPTLTDKGSLQQARTWNRELDHLSYLYPLFAIVIPAIHFVTTSSLLRSELRLLVVSLINLLFFAKSPQIKILAYVLWIGGVGLFVFCMHILRWNVALERVPRWRFQRAIGLVRASNAFLATLGAGLNPSTNIKDDLEEDLLVRDVDEVLGDTGISTVKANGNVNDDSEGDRRKPRMNGRASFSALDGQGTPQSSTRKAGEPIATRLQRSMTLPDKSLPTVPTRSAKRQKRRGSLSSISQIYLSMTPRQAEITKWLYSAYFFGIFLVLVVGPIRYLVATRALADYEPFGWALGYLLRDIEWVRETVLSYNLEKWIILTPPDRLILNGFVDDIRCNLVGTSNMRLLLFGYWAGVIALGVGIVLVLSTSVEVDTRRKVFHGTMVAMLLPTTFIDPPLLALALSLVLAIFLLLDLIRASQLRPLSRPLALFLTPYVDGRDLRGPVVISHIFLLIGCAIPFWLSMAALKRTGSGPWTGWEVETRDVSMVAGVICVGMGDAAASLIGRRFGRHKWPWAGGKSLEGSVAFAAAVSIGLLLAKAWLNFGGWAQTWNLEEDWPTVVGKVVLAGSGASFTEAVLTGCNDNVVVPVILWLLVRGLGI